MSAPTGGTAAADPGEAMDDAFEGAGVVSSLYDYVTAQGEQDERGVTAAGDAACIDALGFVVDPFGSLLEAGLGWAIEHIWFLREPLDALCGDPGRIEDRAEAWHTVAAALRTQAGALDDAVPRAAQGWSGAAADAWLAAAGAQRAALGSVAGTADRVAGLVLDSAVRVATERAVVRDIVAGLAADAVLALIAAVATGGAGFAVALPGVVADAVATAVNLARRVEHLADALRIAAKEADELTGAFAETSRQASRAERITGRIGAVATAAVEEGTGATVEYEKQSGSGRATREEWQLPPTG
ncbi:hypothetical protein [Pseudonocardia phyllosphaerae]|uniref:hypothetical protein n=1 Tax=Pseudonocardia phyllosphaerae TaxID=3390502 RepID=UPI00397E30F8